jgi:hypothetical protein
VYGLVFFLLFWGIALSFAGYISWRRKRPSKMRVQITVRSNYFGENWITVRRGQQYLSSEKYATRSSAKRAALKWQEGFSDAVVIEKYYDKPR